MGVWSNDYKPEKIIQKLEKAKIISSEGKISWRAFEHRQNAGLLEKMITFVKEVPSVEKSRIINQALNKSGKGKKITATNLLIEINKLEAEYCKRPSNKYHLITSISISHLIPLRRISINGCRINFISNIPKSHLEGRDKSLKRHQIINAESDPSNYKYIKINAEGRSIHEAANLALDSLDFVRGVWNYNFNRQTGFRISTLKKQVNTIALGPVHTLHNPSGEIPTDTYWYQREYRSPNIAFDLNDKLEPMYSFYNWVMKQIKKRKYGDDLKLAITRYGRALDFPDLEASYIKLWSVLEQLTSSSFEPAKVTIRRASFPLHDREYHQQVLYHLSQYRNQTVHSDADSLNIELYIYQLKMYVELLFEYLLGSGFDFQSINEAGRIMDSSRDANYLDSKIKELKYIKKFSQT